MSDDDVPAPTTLPLPGADGPSEDTTIENAPALSETTLEGSPSGDAPRAGPPRVGDLEILRELGRGGMGVIYVARHTKLDRLVAVKQLLAGRRDTASLERFHAEARAAARLRHPNIVSVHEVGEERGQPFIIMDLVEGTSLHARIQSEGPLPPPEAGRIAERLARAIAYAHANSILHRDIKPDNVLLAEDGEPLLTDFGLAKDVEDEQGLTQSGQVMGTPAYMPPEQARGDVERVDRRADIYSLGATLYEMLTGRPPFKAPSTMGMLQAVLEEVPVSPRRLAASVDRDLETICLKCLEKDPEDRYGSAGLLADDLERYRKSEPITARPPTVLERVLKWTRRNQGTVRQLGVTVSIALLVGVAGLIWFLSEIQAESKRANAGETAALKAKQDADDQRGVAEEQKALAEDRLKQTEALLGETLEQRGLAAAERRDWQRAAVFLAAGLERRPSPEARGSVATALDSAWRLTRLVGHGGDIRDLTWSPDGTQLASVCMNPDQQVWVWDVDRRLKVHSFPQPGWAQGRNCLAWSPRSDRLAAVGRGVRVWETKSGKTVGEYKGYQDAPSGRGLQDVGWSADGTKLATLGADGSVFVWREDAPLLELKGHEAKHLDMQALEWAPDSKRIATSGSDGVRVWESASGKQVGLLARGRAQLSWSPDSKRLAVAAWGGLALWDAADAEPTWTGSDMGYLGFGRLAWSPSGDRLAAVPNNVNSVPLSNTIHLWPVSNRQFHIVLQSPASVRSLSWSPDGRWLASGGEDGVVRIWEGSTGRLLAALQERRGPSSAKAVIALAWSPQGDRLASIANGSRVVSVWTRPRARLAPTGHRLRVQQIAWSPDGSALMSLGGGGELWLWDTETGAVLGTRYPEFDDEIVGAAWSPDSRRLACWFRKGDVRILKKDDVAAHEPHLLPSQLGSGWTLRWSESGERLLTASSKGRLVLWDVAKAQAISTVHPFSTKKSRLTTAWSPDEALVASFEERKGEVRIGPPAPDTGERKAVRLRLNATNSSGALAWSPDGALLAITSTGALGEPIGFTKLWDRSSGDVIALPEPPAKPRRTSEQMGIACAWSSDGTLLAATSRPDRIAVWNVKSRALVATLTDHKASALSLAWSPNGNILASGSLDQTVRLWRLPEGECLAVLGGFTSGVSRVAWSPDGRRLGAHGVFGSVVRLWSTDGLLAEPSALRPLATRLTGLKLEGATVQPVD